MLVWYYIYTHTYIYIHTYKLCWTNATHTLLHTCTKMYTSMRIQMHERIFTSESPRRDSGTAMISFTHTNVRFRAHSDAQAVNHHAKRTHCHDFCHTHKCTLPCPFRCSPRRCSRTAIIPLCWRSSRRFACFLGCFRWGFFFFRRQTHTDDVRWERQFWIFNHVA
jgi:hypothetical protein